MKFYSKRSSKLLGTFLVQMSDKFHAFHSSGPLYGTRKYEFLLKILEYSVRVKMDDCVRRHCTLWKLL